MQIFSKLTNWTAPVFALAVLGAILYWAFFLDRNVQIFQAIPSQTALVITLQGLTQTAELAKKQEVASGSNLFDLSIVRSGLSDAGQAATVFADAPLLHAALEKNSLALAFSFLPADSLHPLFVLDLGQPIELSELLAPLGGTYKISTAVFKGHSLFTIHIDRHQRLVIASEGRLLLFSRFSFSVEDALVQLGRRGNWWSTQSDQQQLTESKFPVTLLLRTDVLAERLKGKMNPVWDYLPGWLAENFESFGIGWDGHSWNVFSNSKQNLKINRSDAVLLGRQLYSILPDNSALFAWASFSNRSEFEQVLSPAPSHDDFIQFIEPWAETEIAYVWLEPFTPGMLEDQFVVFRVRDKTRSQLLLQDFGVQRGFLKQYDYQTFEIKQYLSQSLLAPVLGKNSAGFQNPVCATIGEYVVFAASASAMELWIDNYLVSQTLANLPGFLQLGQKWQTTGGAALYLNCAYLPLFVKNLAGPEWFQDNKADVRLLQTIGMIGISPVQDKNGQARATLINQPLTEVPSSTTILWKTALGGMVIGSPNIVRLSDDEQAILVQDDQNVLYRLSAEGAIVWRKQMDQPLRSAIRGIDYFNNGRISYLFNTANAIWILNDEGKEIDGFPLNLQSPATNGVTAVDFDATRRHSLFVACANGNLYGFDQFGRPLTGWNPQSGVETVASPLIHFQHGEKDYLAVLSTSGKLSVFNRNGTPHFAPLRFPGTFEQSPLQYDEAPSAPRIVCTNAAGKVFICSIDGQSFSLDMAPAKGKPVCLVYADFFGDHRKDFALLAGKEIAMAGYEKNKLSQKINIMLPAPQDTTFGVGCCNSLGALSRQKRQIFLIDGSGSLHPDFPLAGSTPFILTDLFANKVSKILIVGNGEAVYAYSINGL